uniref:Uncharacterized protein n=1 Tax=Anguilla anguilla TaxID=7936 RepID=A0A0E9TA90_ANGAN
MGQPEKRSLSALTLEQQRCI